MKLKKNIKRIAVILASLALMGLTSNAQSNLVFYHNHDQFNSSNFNPAFLTSQQQFTFSIFPLSGMSVGYNSQSLIKEMRTQFLAGTQNTEDFKGVFNSLVKMDLFLFHYESSLLNLGYNSDFGSFNFRIKENVQLMTGFKGELSTFFMEPTYKTIVIGQPQYFAAEALHNREYSLGYAKEIIKNKLTIGVRAKIYFGKSTLFSEVSGAIIEKDDLFYMRIAGPMRLSIPAKPQYENDFLKDLNLSDNFNIGSYINNTKNFGTGVDLGIKYKITPEIELSASVIDFGRIKWKNNINTMIYNNEYPFPKQNIEPGLNENGVPILTKTIDKPLTDTISFNLKIDETAFSKPLPTTFYVGLQYQLNPYLNLGVVNRFTRVENMSHNSFSLTASYDVNKKLTLITGYSIFGNIYNNIPLALLYKWGSGQTYIGTDNLLSTLFPSFSEVSGITFGTCFYLFRGKVKYKEPLEYLPFYKQRKSRSANKKGLLFNKHPHL